jgi:predicted Zn-dependent protease with MMP-like domain
MRNSHPKLTTEAFAHVVEQAIARIPEELRKRMENILISVKQQPDTEMLEEMGLAPDEPLFGIYWGVPLTERSLADPPLYPDTIYIFQQPLEAFCTSREELLEEIEITVVHEIAHLFGFSEADLKALGYG